MLASAMATLKRINVFDLLTTITLPSDNMNCFSIWFKIIQYLIYFYWHYIIILYNFS